MLEHREVSERILSALAADGLDPEIAEAITFHLTVWRRDLENLLKIWNQADQMSDDEIRTLIIRFLVHVPEHVAAAKKLSGCGAIVDLFAVGVCENDEPNDC